MWVLKPTKLGVKLLITVLQWPRKITIGHFIAFRTAKQ